MKGITVSSAEVIEFPIRFPAFVPPCRLQTEEGYYREVHHLLETSRPNEAATLVKSGIETGVFNPSSDMLFRLMNELGKAHRKEPELMAFLANRFEAKRGTKDMPSTDRVRLFIGWLKEQGGYNKTVHVLYAIIRTKRRKPRVRPLWSDN